MVWSLVSAKRRRRLVDEATRSRQDAASVIAAVIAIVVYNLVGLADIYSTWIGVKSGLGEEVNPLMRLAMDNLGPGWITAKLALQLLISGMVLWFPHRIVLAIFVIAVAFNAGVVYSNLQVAGIF